MHTMWKGSISFGLVNIPIKLYAATEDKDIKLRTLHKKCHSPIQYEKTCPNCDEEVKQEEIVKGYEYVKGKYVVLTDEELKELKDEHEDKTVEIIDFVKMDDIDPIYFNRSYFIGPGENGGKAYGLLREALTKSEKIGIAEITIRSKQQLAMVRVYQNCIVMETVHYPDEVRNVKEVPSVPENVEVGEKELDTAIMLIDQLTTIFEPEKYKDDYRLALQELIERKVNQDEGKTPTEAAPRQNVVDLMSALQASIEKTKKPQTKAKPAKPKAKSAKAVGDDSPPKKAHTAGTTEKKTKTVRKKA
ncbi:Ku protein [Metabacillus halosaccharovorans]|uniref:Non-homologous end joining protein Ku n=1 Tax=Metabacillus halosaccharovorans TaxID=930124 RepID=A0ABT3DHV0_9BACI|nr:Ku protein [Metabacillus halosaccharovorans]MCM3441670.1 Ku protein [Metabacillus halosaccharovorans]MCV9886479.1 Ku protein [Metabacillus halosaccharovorans]